MAYVTFKSQPGGHTELIPPRGPGVEGDMWTDRSGAPEVRNARGGVTRLWDRNCIARLAAC